MLIAHRVNTIPKVYGLYYKKGVRHIEIDVQPTKDDVIVVHHDNISSQKYNQARHTRLDDFLKFIPDDIWINVELKRYDDKIYVDALLKICSQHRGKRFFFSSFDELFYRVLRAKKGTEAGYLHEDTRSLMKAKVRDIICVHIDLLLYMDLRQYKAVYVWGLSGNIHKLKERYDWVAGWIVDVD